MFAFLSCADPQETVRLNIESKINAEQPNLTVSVDEFVDRLHNIFVHEGAGYYRNKGAITFQSFEWRTLLGMKRKDKEGKIALSALIDACVYSFPWPFDPHGFKSC
jgi:hypothetical protein